MIALHGDEIDEKKDKLFNKTSKSFRSAMETQGLTVTIKDKAS